MTQADYTTHRKKTPLTHKVIDLDLPSGAYKPVLVALARFANPDGTNAYPGTVRLARAAGFGERTVQKVLAHYQQAGIIVSENGTRGGRGRRTIYRLDLTHADGWRPPKPRNPMPPLQPQTPQSATLNPAISNTAHKEVDQTIDHNERKTLPESKEKESDWTIDHPWLGILAQDERWVGKSEQWVHDIEKNYPQLNLVMEAHKCYEWFQGKGRRHKTMIITWLGWLERAAKDAATPQPPSTNGRRRIDADLGTHAEMVKVNEDNERRGPLPKVKVNP